MAGGELLCFLQRNEDSHSEPGLRCTDLLDTPQLGRVYGS
ncbi:hypothetical protein C8J48_0572 [Desmospora activa DSM 45169]|uniref:Uncharacterized protein n=1 Tax=Desmospora activa DSM 45169 TaxID=1121389 RepID=A0A2T4Z7Y5_9BACL|nr:hypothetical protein C8J48_0572 [Desmospora activa DSM 45169]